MLLSRYFKLLGRALAFVILASAGGSLWAQTSVGQIAGTVSDASGGVLPGANVTIVNVGTRAERAVVTDENGFYVVTNLPIGDYSIEVAGNGFRGEKRSGISVTADAHLT